jgi:C-methyltransferase C-terminal domain/Putative zinc binding domain/Methyltransferase domain
MDIRPLARIATCRGCGHGEPETVFDLGMQPFANGLLDRPGEAEPVYPLEVSCCAACGLAQLSHTAPPSDLFSSYVWVTGTSRSTRAYATHFCDTAMATMPGGLRESYVLEVASNDGTFLKPFRARGMRVLGVDAAVNVAAIAKGEGIPTRVGFFGSAMARDIVAESGPASLVVARNVLPHVADVNDFVRGLCMTLAAHGVLMLEVHYGRTIIEGLHYDSIYHEHLCYYTVASLDALLERHGLTIAAIDSSPISGGSLVLTVVRGDASACRSVARDWIAAEQEAHTNERDTWRQFSRRARAHADTLAAMLAAERAAGRVIAGYGASARGSTLVNYAALGPFLTAIADQNEMKQGRYSPGAHLPICSPEELMRCAPDTILVLAWNFFEEIAALLRGELRFRGRIIKPLPDILTYS